MNIRIYQVNMSRDPNHIAFMNYESLPKFQGSSEIDSSVYDKVFEGDVNCTNLEEVYQMFNLNHPAGYKARSLSVSDVVEVIQEDGTRDFHFCDSFGFRKVAFKPDKCEISERFCSGEEKDTVSVLLVQAGKYPKLIEIKDSLEAMQALVGGDIEEYMPTRYNNAKKAIDEAIAMSRNLRQFQYELGVMGYHSNFSPNRKYATVTPKGSEKPIRTYRLGEEYTKEKIIERLTANRDSIVFKPFQPKTYIIRQYRLPTRENKIQKVGGLYGLYLYYCYRLGYLPKYNQKQQNTARLHYLLKDDLMKLDELTKQVTLLGKHQIGTDEQLFSYKRSVEAEIKTLTVDRTHLRNEIRKVDISDERLSATKAKISAISERLKELRKEEKLCDGIAKRSGLIADTLSQVKAEEEKSQRKESRKYEQRR